MRNTEGLMLKSGETFHQVINVLLLGALVIGLAIILVNRWLLPQAPPGGNTYPPPALVTSPAPAPVETSQVILPVTTYPTPEVYRGAATVEAIVDQSPCVFHGKPSQESPAFALDDFTFSEPQVLMTATHQIMVHSWLPDNRRVLVSYLTHIEPLPGMPPFKEHIGLVDIKERMLSVFAERDDFQNPPPVWLQSQNAVFFSEVIKPDPQNRPEDYSIRLSFSRGDPKKLELVAEHLPGRSLAASPSDDRIVYTAANYLRVFSASRKEDHPVLTRVRREKGQETRIALGERSYQSAWRPGSDQVVLYDQGVYGLTEQTLLVDVTSGDTCKIDLPGWTGAAQWSPNGRYLGLLQFLGQIGNAYTSNLVILDTSSGEKYILKAAQPGDKGPHFIKDLAWAPDNQHLAIVDEYWNDQASENSDGMVTRQLFLLDFIQNTKKQIFPSNKFGEGYTGEILAWSPDGLNIVIRCPGGKTKGLCLISVKMPSNP
jgi:Tol biopolymer transport system component